MVNIYVIWAIAYQPLGDLSKGLRWVTFEASSWCLNIWFFYREELTGFGGIEGIEGIAWRHWFIPVIGSLIFFVYILMFKFFASPIAKQCSSYKTDLGIRFWVSLFPLVWCYAPMDSTNFCERSCYTCFFFDLLASRNTCIQAVAFLMDSFYQSPICRCRFIVDLMLITEVKDAFLVDREVVLKVRPKLFLITKARFLNTIITLVFDFNWKSIDFPFLRTFIDSLIWWLLSYYSTAILLLS